MTAKRSRVDGIGLQLIAGELLGLHGGPVRRARSTQSSVVISCFDSHRIILSSPVHSDIWGDAKLIAFEAATDRVTMRGRASGAHTGSISC